MHDAAHSRRLVTAITAALLLTIVATLAFALYQARASALDDWRGQLTNTSLLLAQQASNEMAAADLVLDGMLERITTLHVDSDAALHRQFSTQAEFDGLLARKKALPQIDVATITDSQGNIVNFTRGFPTPPINLADRDYFAVQRDHPTRASYISRPVRNRGNGEWTFYLSRRISAPDGRFLGTVLVGLSSRRLSDFFSKINLGPDAMVTLYRRDFTMLARWPHTDALIGTVNRSGSSYAVIEAGRQQAGTVVVDTPRRSQGDVRVTRMGAARVVPNYPMLINVTVTEALFLRQWRRAALQLASMSGLCCLAVIAACGVLLREVRRRDGDMQLQRALQLEADAANRAKSDFLAMMSHEIRTPLTSVIGFAEQMAHAQSAREAAELGGIIARNGQTLLALINDILDMSKLESGKLALEQLAFAPREALAAVTLLMSGQAQERGLRFDTRLDPACPDAVHGDPIRWRQILMNLVSNAIKFTERGSVAVEVWYEPAQQALYCRVSDTGIGMDSQQVARLFQPFEQADGSIARRFGGTGLGLYLVRQLAQAMGGGVAIDTAPGAGTRITVHARATPAAQPLRQEPAAAAPAAADGQLAGRVLLVEDGEDNRRLVTAMLQRRGLDVRVAVNGEEGIDAAWRTRPDLVLMDIQMPVLDGLAAVRRLRAAGFQAPIVALTANVLPQDQARYHADGFDACLAKPIDRAAFDRALERFLPGAPAPASLDSAELEGFEAIRLSFVASLAGRFAQIRAALDTGDLAAARMGAHTLKGSAATFGCPGIGIAAGQLELCCRAADPAGSLAALDALYGVGRSEAPEAFADDQDGPAGL